MTNPPQAILLTPGGRLTRIPLKGSARQVLAGYLHTDHIEASAVGVTGIHIWHLEHCNPDLDLNMGAMRLWDLLSNPSDPYPLQLTGDVVLAGRRNGEPTELPPEGTQRLRQLYEQHAATSCPICLDAAAQRLVRPPVHQG